MSIAKSINDRCLDRCVVEDKHCPHKESKVTHYALDPLPKVLTFNINWFDNQVPYMDTLRFSVSIPQKFQVSELFELADTQTQVNHEFILKGVVCFLGAHYMTYIKTRNVNEGETTPYWQLFDDNKPIQLFSSWGDILEKILEFGTLPTVLIYERANDENKFDDRLD